MRIHTNLVEWADLTTALQVASAGGHGRVSFQEGAPTVHGSRTHRHAFEVKLEGDGTHSRRRTNPGTAWRNRTDELSPYAATYDAWGWFLGKLYALDPTMVAGPYRSASDFHAQTKWAYLDLPTPAPFAAAS